MKTNKRIMHKNELNYIKNPSRKLKKVYIKGCKKYNDVFKKCNKAINKYIFEVTEKNALLPFDYIVIREDGIYVYGLLHAMGEFELEDPLTNKFFEFDAFQAGEILYNGYNPYYEIANCKENFINFLISRGALKYNNANIRKVVGVAVRLDNTSKFGWNTNYYRPVVDSKINDVYRFLNSQRFYSVLSADEISCTVQTLKTLPNLRLI